MNRHTILLISWLMGGFGLLMLASCGGDDDAGPPTGTPTATASPAGTATRASSTATPEASPTTAASPTPTVARPTTAQVEGSDTCLNVRDKPETGGKILACYPDGTSLKIWGDLQYGFEYDWLAVETDTGERGWAVTDFLAFDQRGFPASYSVPVHPPETRTGVREVDALITAVHAGNATALAENISSISIGCITTPRGIGAPPLCEADEPEGTMLDVLPSAVCEGYYARVAQIGDEFHALTRHAPRIFAVFEVEDGDANPNWPLGEYAVVFALGNGWARTVYIDSSGIVNVWYGCGGSAFDHADRGTTFVLPAPARPN